jgi:hypothetical protein
MLTIRILTLSVGVMLVASCNRFTEARLVGTWRDDNEVGIEEIALDGDHTFRALNTFKKELVIPSVTEETGTWQVEGNQLKLDGTVTWSKKGSNTTMSLLQITKDTLVARRPGGNMNVTYTRLRVPACATSIVGGNALNEAYLFDTWQIHSNTHDYQYSFRNDHSVSVSALNSGRRFQVDEGTWRLSGNDIVMQFKNSGNEPANEEERWAITGTGADCFAIKAGQISYTLSRVK